LKRIGVVILRKIRFSCNAKFSDANTGFQADLNMRLGCVVNAESQSKQAI